MIRLHKFTFAFLFLFIGIGILHLPAFCFAQQNNETEKIIIIQRTHPKRNQDSVETFYRVHARVRVETSFYYDGLRGKIDSITDSALLIKKKWVKIADIQSINKVRGRKVGIIGASTLGTGGVLLSLFAIINGTNGRNIGQAYYEPISPYAEVAMVFVMAGGLFITMGGGIASASSHHYRPDSETKMFIGTPKQVPHALWERSENTFNEVMKRSIEENRKCRRAGNEAFSEEHAG